MMYTPIAIFITRRAGTTLSAVFAVYDMFIAYTFPLSHKTSNKGTTVTRRENKINSIITFLE